MTRRLFAEFFKISPDFKGTLAAEPRYITRGAAGVGFAELVAHLLGAV